MRRVLNIRQRGFTIVEAIIVMVITGIIGAVIASFIKLPVRGYLDSVARAEATDVADNTMRRLTRELRLALPNSVRANGTAIEFIETRVGLRYLADDDIGPVGGIPLSWTDVNAFTFSVVGGIPGGRHAPVVNDFVVIYNLGPGQDPANAYADCAGPCNRAQIRALDPVASTMTLAANPFAAQRAAGTVMMSPVNRFHVITGPVSYVCDPATRRLTRRWGYGFQPAQPITIAGGNSAILAENVVNCNFVYDTLATQNSALIRMTLTLQVRDENNSQVTLMHQVHVDNTP